MLSVYCIHVFVISCDFVLRVIDFKMIFIMFWEILTTIFCEQKILWAGESAGADG